MGLVLSRFGRLPLFSILSLRTNDFEMPDLMAAAYEYLMIMDVGKKVKELIGAYLESIADPKTPPIELLDSKFLVKVKKHQTNRIQALLLKYAIKRHIKANHKKNPTYYSELNRQVNYILKDKCERWDDLALALFNFRRCMVKAASYDEVLSPPQS